MSLDYAIRAATQQDIPHVYAMAKTLAEIQGLLHRLCITEDSLRYIIADPNASTKTIVAADEGTVTAFAMYTLIRNNQLYHHGFAMYIDELFVLPHFRGQGIGTTLFKYIANEAIHNQCNRVEWWVSTGNEDAAAFYAHLGARPLDEFKTFRLQEPALSKFAVK